MYRLFFVETRNIEQGPDSIDISEDIDALPRLFWHLLSSDCLEVVKAPSELKESAMRARNDYEQSQTHDSSEVL